MVEWLDHIDLPYRFVATKSDKVRSSKSSKRRQDLTAKLGVEKSAVLWVSAESGDGIPQFRFIGELANVRFPSIFCGWSRLFGYA